MKRRDLLAVAGAAAACAPGLSHFLRSAEAADSVPQRVVFLISRNGMWDGNFFPESLGVQPFGDGLGVQSALGTSPVLGAEFDALRSQMSVVRGLDGMFNTGHNRCAPLCASTTPGSVFLPPPFALSADTILGQHLYGDTSPLQRVLRVSAAEAPKTYNNSWSWTLEAGEARQLPVLSYPAALASLLGGFTTNAPVVGQPEPPPPRYAEQALSRVENRYQALISDPRLPALQRHRLEAHLENLSRAVATPTAASGAACTAPEREPPTSTLERSQSTLALVASALACDLTRVATVDLAVASDLGFKDTSWHENSHFPAVQDVGPAGLLPYSQWVAARVGEFLTRLASTPDADGRSVLDNTLVVWTNELAWGNTHDAVSMPVVLAGATDWLQGGTLYDFRQSQETVGGNLVPRRRGVPYNFLFNTVFEAFNIAPEAYDPAGSGDGFGQWDDPSGVTGAYAPFLATKRRSLGVLG